MDINVLQRMMDIQRHRGPDDQGMRLFSLRTGTSAEPSTGSQAINSPRYEGGVGFNRLSILDLSKSGHQPMCDEAEQIFIAFNGEIYNAFDLRPDLESRGCRFRSKTDTEVILYLYKVYGFEGMLEHLNGMFAICIFDLRQKQIFIARDHFGIKPMYWTLADGVLLFSSEIKSFYPHPAFRPEVDTDKIDEYLAFRYCAGDGHLIKGVKQLRPGHYLKLTLDGHSIHRYWTIPDSRSKRKTSLDESISNLDFLLKKSVQSQLLSDVKVGCQLSGGLDSSMVTLFARSHFDADMETFSVVFNDPVYSEEKWIELAAKAADAISHRFIFDASYFFDNFKDATWHMEQPINHPNALGIYLLAQESRKFVTVLLSGEGADELFGGYTRFYTEKFLKRTEPLFHICRGLPGVGSYLDRRARRNHYKGQDHFVAASMTQFCSPLLGLKPDFNIEKVLAERRIIFDEGAVDHIDNCLKYDMQTYMVDLLIRQDKMTMAHSLENRVPFLDRDLVGFIRTLPNDFLVGNKVFCRNRYMRSTKVILKNLASRYFDESFVYRLKSGFPLPLEDYFQDKRFEQIMEDVLLPSMKRRGLMDVNAIENQWSGIKAGNRNSGKTFWIPIAFEMWAQTFLDSPYLS